ncbi:gp53-like domain-containing protein [Brevundimonas phoenicis]|uniref:gp53-like domain-containing protein n=1 Tax=unclassified Brevundimonas TaxID=2622653 RepID=UPI0039A1D76A
MSGFQITITDAGRAALINAQNTGTAAFVLSQIGVSTQAIAGDLASLAVLPNERKRLATMAGDVVADDTLHVTIRDESADAYALRSFGLYDSTGVLFAVYSQADPILEKSAAAMLLLAVDARLVALGTANVEFGPVGFTLPPASETVAGVVEIATDAEVDVGQDPWRVITARTLKRALGALSNFALKDHKHDAGDVETGTFHANRIPELPMSRIGGLIATLADKASALHSHTMAQVSGLVAALALKADLASPAFSGTAAFANALVNGVLSISGAAPGNRRIFFRTDAANRWAINVNGVAETGGNSGSHFTVERFDDAGAYVDTSFHINRATGQVTMPKRPGWAGAVPWDNANFNPDSRVSVAATNLGATWDVPLTKLSSAAQFAALPSGFTSMVTPDSVGTPGGYGYLFKMARRDSGHGWTGLWINHTAAPGDAPELYVGSAMVGSELPVWTRAWTWANFNPATKANVQYPDFYGQINLESGPARFRAIGDGDSLFLQAGTATGNNGNMILSGLFGQNLTSLRAQIGGALRDLFHTGNFNPASKADLNGWTNPDGDATVNGNKTFACPVDNTIARGNLDFGRGALEVRAKTGDGAAYLTFHRPGQFAAFFGVDTDGELKFGGWSLGEVSYRIWSERNLRQANPAEAAAGVAHDRFITPSALWSFAKSIGPNGYQQIPGTDLIIQWGVSNGSHPEGAVHAALPVAFGGGCLFACATPRNAGQAYGMDFVMQIVGRYLDRIVFYANRANSSSGNMSGYEWMAIGLARGNPDPVYSSGYPPGGGGGGGGGGGEDPFIRPEV